MANEIQVSTGQMPAYLQKLQYVDSGLGAGVAPRAPKLGITTAREWTITRDGQKIILPDKSVRVVLVASASNITKAWYEKPFVPGSTEAPDCFSNDGKVPAAGVKKKQANSCAVCPKNAFGSHPVTGRGKACGDRKMVVLVWEGEPDTLMTFNLPTQSMQNLKRIDDELKKANIPPQAVLMELRFDPAYTYPVVQMGAVGFVDEGTATRLLALKDSEEVAQLLREEQEQHTEEAPTQTEVVPTKTIQFGTAQAEVEPAPEPEKPKRKPRQKKEDSQVQQQAAPEPVLVDEEEEEEEEDEQAASAQPSNVLSLLQKWKTN